MIQLQFSFPKLYYLQAHLNERGSYIYADDLFSPSNWKKNLGEWDNIILKFFNERKSDSHIKDKQLLLIKLSDKKSISDNHQTIVGNMISHNINTIIGTTIRNEYEHISPGGSQTQTASIANVDNIVKVTSELTSNISTFKDALNNNIRNVVSPEKVDFHNRYLKGEEDINNIIVSKNPNFQQFNILPEMVGVDVASISTSGSDKYPTEFIASSLVGWNFSSPQEKSVGCAGDLASIISDVVWLTMAKNFSGERITKDSNQNIKYILKEISPLYESLITSPLISSLSAYGEDFGDIENPVILGVRNNQAKVPSIYGLWCIYRSVRTPFYNRQLVTSSQSSVSIENLFPFTVVTTENAGTDEISGFTLSSKQVGQQEISSFKNEVMKNLRNSIKVSGFTTTQGVFLEEKEIKGGDLAAKSLVRFFKKLESQNNNFWVNLISGAIGNIASSLLVASQINWKLLSDRVNEPSVFSEGLVKFRTGDISVGNASSTIDLEKIIPQLKAMSVSSYLSLQNIIYSNFGTSAGTAMGGTSLEGNQEITTQRFAETITYPGDMVVMEQLSGYLDLLNSDLGTIGNSLMSGIDNMTNMYWKRDLLRWMEVMFIIFNFEEEAKTYDNQRIRLKFVSLERIVKILYTKQIGAIKDYLQKMASLERRIQKNNQSSAVERQAKLASYFTSTTVCYLKRQILIIYYLLNRIGSSEIMKKNINYWNLFSSNSKKTRYELVNWFKIQINDLTKGVTNPDMLKTIQSYSKDICGDSKVESGVEVTASKSLISDDLTNKIISDPKFWLLAMANLKKMDSSVVATNPELLKKLFIPIFETVGKKKRFYLFDLIPFVIKGAFTGAFGTKSPPNWHTTREIIETKILEKDPAYVIVCNESSKLTNDNEWKAINIQWFQNLVKKATDYGKEDTSKKMFIIRYSIYLLLSDQMVYKNIMENNMGSPLSNDIDSIKIGGGGESSRMKQFLININMRGYEEKKQINKFIDIISREMFSIDLENARVIFQSI